MSQQQFKNLVSVNQAAKELGMKPETVKAFAIYSGLAFQYPGSKRIRVPLEKLRLKLKRRNERDSQPDHSHDLVTYFVQDVDGGPIKIGKTINMHRRLFDLQKGFFKKLVCLGYVAGDRERELHDTFADLRIMGEWFRPCTNLLKFIWESCYKATGPGAAVESEEVFCE